MSNKRDDILDNDWDRNRHLGRHCHNNLGRPLVSDVHNNLGRPLVSDVFVAFPWQLYWYCLH